MRLPLLHAHRSKQHPGWACVPSRHMCMYHTYILYTSLYELPAIQINTDKHTEHSHKHSHHQWPQPALLSGWMGWRFIGGKYSCVYCLQSCPDLWMLTPSSYCVHGHMGPHVSCGLTLFAGTDTPIDKYAHWAGVHYPGKYLDLGRDWSEIILHCPLYQRLVWEAEMGFYLSFVSEVSGRS